MANRLTRVPDRPAPDLPRWIRPVVAAGDVFMIVMVSRPRTGSLRNTWVTPATLWMCVATLGACVTGMLLLGTSAPAMDHKAVLGIRAGLLALAAGAGAVALVGITQRRTWR